MFTVVMMRKAPRIISRRKRPPPPQSQADRYSSTGEGRREDFEDEIGEGVIVQGGVMMRLVEDEEAEDYMRHAQVQPPQKFPRHITVEAPPLPFPNVPYVENPLPGVADEVESYPCRICPDRVFLTSFGLERHAKAVHPEHLDETLQEITRIHEEWKRRDVERCRQRERIALAKTRQEAIADAIARDALARDLGTDDLTDLDPLEDDFSSNRSFEPCRICGILINAFHPSAMVNHMRAHTKNDELRSHMLAEYGSEYVSRVTCHDCQLVFADERKLNAHIEVTHQRKRKYVCKWCGTVCMSMADLNAHKADVHGVPVSRSRADIRRFQIQQAVTSHMTGGNRGVTPLGTKGVIVRSSGSSDRLDTQGGSTCKLMPLIEDTPCRTTCNICNLMMVKPSLLIRHMLRVHNSQCFSAIIEMKGMPDIKVDVDKGRLTWWCCEQPFYDRYHFLYHRRSCHQPKFDFVQGNVQDDIDLRGPSVSSAAVEGAGQQVLGADENNIIQLIENSDPNTQPQNVYVLLVADPDAEEGKAAANWGEMPVDADVPAGYQQIALTAEQYEQLRTQIDGDLNNMQVVFMDEDEEQLPNTSVQSTSTTSSGSAFMPMDSLVSSDSAASENEPSTVVAADTQSQSSTAPHMLIPGITVTGHNPIPDS